MTMHKGCDKRYCKTLTLIKAIFIILIHLDVLPSSKMSRMPSCPDAQTVDIQAPVFSCLPHMHRSQADAVTRALTTDNVISPFKTPSIFTLLDNTFGYLLSETRQIEGVGTPRPRYHTGLTTKSIMLTGLFT